jgi:hypothetical protein
VSESPHSPFSLPFSPLLRIMANKVFSWAFILFEPTSSFLFIFFSWSGFCYLLHHVLDVLNLFIIKLFTNHGLT